MVESRLKCPYCAGMSAVQIERPPVPRRREAVPLQASPSEVKTAPYARDVGRFDPPLLEDYRKPGRGSWIGDDFFPRLGFDQRNGVLGTVSGWPGVVYRVERCDLCHRDFDAYYSYSGTELSQEWPHLFSSTPDLSTGSLFLSWVRDSFRGSREPAWTRVAFGSFLFSMGAGFLPFVLAGAASWQDLVIYLAFLLIGVSAAVQALHYSEDLLEWLSHPDEFKDVLELDQHGVMYWLNFARRRFTGDQKAEIQHPSQIEIYGSTIALVLLIAVPCLAGVPLLGVVGFLALQGSLAFAWLTITKRFPKLPRGIAWSVWLGSFTATTTAVTQSTIGNLVGYGQAYQVATLAPVSIILGSSLLIAFVTVQYILVGVTRVPLRLIALTLPEFVRCLRHLRDKANEIGLAAFIAVIGALSLLGALRNVQPGSAGHFAWLGQWLIYFALALLVAYGVTLRRPFFTMTILVSGIIVALLPNSLSLTLMERQIFVDPRVVAVGLIFTAVLSAQSSTADTSIRSCIDNTLSSKLGGAAVGMLAAEHSGHSGPRNGDRVLAISAISSVAELKHAALPRHASPALLSLLLPALLEASLQVLTK